MASNYTYVSTLICDDCRKEDTGKYIAIGIYPGSIVTPQLPLLMPILAIRFEVVPDKRRYENVTATIKDPEGRETVRVGGIIEFSQANVPSSFFFRISPVLFQNEGKHTVSLAMDGELDEIYEFKVQVTAQSEKAAA